MMMMCIGIAVTFSHAELDDSAFETNGPSDRQRARGEAWC